MYAPGMIAFCMGFISALIVMTFVLVISLRAQEKYWVERLDELNRKIRDESWVR